MFGYITKIRAVLDSKNDMDKFSHHIVIEKITNEYFFAHFHEILLMFGFIAKRNIKLVFGTLAITIFSYKA